MRGDRRLALLALARARGAVDFGAARPDDRLWWLGVGWVTDRLEADECARVWSAEHDLVCAALSRLPPGSEDVGKLLEQSDRLVGLLRRHLAFVDAEAAADTQRRGLADAWKARWGDWARDPEARARVEATAAALRARGRGRKGVRR